MDLREKKTLRGIKTAFLQLRKCKDIARITVKELSELAEISKATFYLHYKDIYDLNETLQGEAIRTILSEIAHPESYIHDRRSFLSELMMGFEANLEIIDILFSGSQEAALPILVEKELQAFVHRLIPQYTVKQDMLLTYQIQGSCHVYQKYHKEYGVNELIQFLEDMAEAANV